MIAALAAAHVVRVVGGGKRIEKAGAETTRAPLCVREWAGTGEKWH